MYSTVLVPPRSLRIQNPWERGRFKQVRQARFILNPQPDHYSFTYSTYDPLSACDILPFHVYLFLVFRCYPL